MGDLTKSQGLLNPMDRAEEILFGLIVALSFTCSISIANSHRTEIKQLLVGAIGCNLAWGLVKENNFFYMYSELAIRLIRPIRTGIIAQRTKLFESELELQRGLFAEYYFGRCRAGFFYFNPFSSDNFGIASFSVDF